MADECRHGCQYLEACLIDTKAKHSLALTEGKAMSQALWCDEHDGPFSSKDNEQRTITSDSQDENGNPIREQFTMCGPCAGRFRVGGPKVLPAVEASPPNQTLSGSSADHSLTQDGNGNPI